MKDEPPQRQGTTELVLRILRGESGALVQLHQRLEGEMRSVARRCMSPVVRAAVGASEVIQDVWIKVSRNSHRFRGQTGAEWRAWIARIVRNAVNDLKRRFVRNGVNQVPLPDDSNIPDRPSSDPPAASLDDQRQRLEAALASLPEAQREAYVLKKFKKWRVSRIAQHLGRTDVAVGGLIRRATAKLLEILKPDQPEELE